MQQPVTRQMVVYEQPLNERMRTLLRLEFLFAQVESHRGDVQHPDSRIAITSLLDIYGLCLIRTDLKSELIKELDRHAVTLKRLRESQQVDQERLMALLDELSGLSAKLREIEGQIGSHLRSNEFLNTIRQRNSIPGGSCGFDLPLYQYWLQLPKARRQGDLEIWLSGFEMVQRAVEIILHLVRQSNNPRIELAKEGFYQESIPTVIPCQLVRVGLSDQCECYPEISGGKHRFTIRLMRHINFTERPRQINEDVEIELTLCLI